MEAVEPSQIWYSQVCPERHSIWFSPAWRRTYLGTASTGTLEPLTGTSLSSRATCPKRPRLRHEMISIDHPNGGQSCPTGDYLVEDMVIPIYLSLASMMECIQSLPVLCTIKQNGDDAYIASFVSNWNFCCRHRVSSDRITMFGHCSCH